MVYTGGRKAMQKWVAEDHTIDFHHRTACLMQMNTDFHACDG